MIHFAYPNVNRDSQFIGCGRFAVFSEDQQLEDGYTIAEPDSQVHGEVISTVSTLGMPPLKSKQRVGETKDKPEEDYTGPSLGLAYLLAVVNCIRELKSNIPYTSNIWCTGNIVQGTLKQVRRFEGKLKAFLSDTNDKLFIVPARNINQRIRLFLDDLDDINIVSLHEFSIEELLEKKTVLVVYEDELEQLIDAIFESEEESLFTFLLKNPFLILGFFVALCAGGFFWNMLNRLLGWTYYMGGSGNEPHGVHAFIWGAITLFPIICSAMLGCYKRTLRKGIFFLWGIIILCYAIFGGIAGVLFYDLGFRPYIEPKMFGYGSQELLIVLIWSAIMSGVTFFPFLLVSRVSKRIVNVWYLSLQIPLSVGFSLVGVILSLVIARSITEVNLFRGLLAALALRSGLYMGFVLGLWKHK